MKVPLNWVRKYTKIDMDNETLIPKIFTQIGAVEHIEDLDKKYAGILIAEIVEKKDHPDSEKLGIYQANIGQDKPLQVVAGDRTLEIGDKVAYFPIGSKIPYNAHPEKNDNVISKITLRGIESNGMFASARELDLGSDHTHVLKLDKDLKAGDQFAKVFELNDVVLEIENKALANRGDCFGILGVACEIAGIQGKKFEFPNWYVSPTQPKVNKKKELTVINNAKANCPRYMAVVMDGIEIKESPLWMQVLLCEVGIKPINNVVDITNYLMALTSQPMHAFDYDKVLAKDGSEKATIVVRTAKNGEKILGINNKIMELDDSMMVISDSKNPIAVAGVVGGVDTEIDNNTKSIILECANFNRYNIRKTSWKLGVTTDAVTRYTKLISPEICQPVIYQAMKLISELASGSVSSEVSDEYEIPQDRKKIQISTDKLNTTIGTELPSSKIAEILTCIGYQITDDGSNMLSLVVPINRLDLVIPEDVYEDVARLYDFNEVPVTLPERSIRPTQDNKTVDIKNEVREILSACGANEVLTYNFIGENLIKQSNLEISDAYHIKNSLSPDLEYMRPSLLPSLLSKAQDNINRGFGSFALFEINVSHNKKDVDEYNLPIETWTASQVVINDQKTEGSAYYDSNVYIEKLAKALNLRKLTYSLISEEDISRLPIWMLTSIKVFNPNSTATVSFEVEGKKYFLGVVGELTNIVKRNFKLPIKSSAFEVNILALISCISPNSRYQEPSRYPKITQDLCFVIEKSVPYIAMRDEIEKVLVGSELYYEIETVDIYSSKKDKENKQITFRISLQSREKPIGNEEFDKVKKKLVYLLGEKFKAQLI